jgi:hypothetical protein
MFDLVRYPVYEGCFKDLNGNWIKPGDEIKLHFAGQPNHKEYPLPSKLKWAEKRYSSVSGKNELQLIISYANGNMITFPHAEIYQPHKP